ncbi:hypothetical protein QCA50_016613 [Cerrena zonata]|uniref:Uncharacterized protein n=1 Tax=Cerrena zonata TaxID=2478898 RepID=A0AAW0FS70_9APHY
MNKLRKKPPPRQNPDVQASPSNMMSTAVAIGPAIQSRTMALARENLDITTVSPSAKHSHLATTYTKSRQQMTTSEQYWAARALTAETMLTANAQYQLELRNLSESEQMKRSGEIAALQKQHEERHSKLERLAFLLLTWVMVMVAVIIYLVLKNHNVPVSSRFSTPLHFTIPVLSPFTSVVEQETSVVNARIIAVVSLFGAATVYGCFRYWISHQRR